MAKNYIIEHMEEGRKKNRKRNETRIRKCPSFEYLA